MIHTYEPDVHSREEALQYLKGAAPDYELDNICRDGLFWDCETGNLTFDCFLRDDSGEKVVMGGRPLRQTNSLIALETPPWAGEEN